jgi:hypothetical protein
MLRWLDRSQDEPIAWQKAAWFGDRLLHLTAEELTALGQKLEELVAPYEQRVFDPEQRPIGSRLVAVLQVAIPREEDPDERVDPS